MSETMIEVVRAAFDDYARRDVDGFLARVATDFELKSAIIGGAEGQVYRGHEAIRQWFDDSDAGFEELTIEPSEFRDLGNRVLVLGRIRARGRQSGVELDSPTGWVVSVKNGLLTNAHGFLTWREALEVAGVSE